MTYHIMTYMMQLTTAHFEASVNIQIHSMFKE